MLRSIMSEYLVDTNEQTQLPRNRGPQFCIQNKNHNYLRVINLTQNKKKIILFLKNQDLIYMCIISFTLTCNQILWKKKTCN
jgi:hypothetical protein